MDLLVSIATVSRVLSLLCHDLPSRDILPMNPEERSDEPELPERLRSIPGPGAFRDLCRRADEGDPRAREKLDRMISEAPDLVDRSLDAVGAAKRLVLDSICGESYFLRESVNQKLSGTVDHMLGQAGDDPICRMLAEMTAIAWLDATRCGVVAAKEAHSQRDNQHVHAVADRSYHRFTRILDVWQKHVRRGSGR